jgi:hypothetical protein
MAGKRKQHSAAFKAEVAVEHAVHPTLIHARKKQLLANAADHFGSPAKAAACEHETLQAQLYE